MVHVELDSCFTISLAHLMPMWADTLLACREAEVRRVIVEGTKPERLMEPLDAYAHGDFLSGLDYSGLRVAFCLYDYEGDGLTQHFLRVANSGGTSVRLFNNIDDALTWVGM